MSRKPAYLTSTDVTWKGPKRHFDLIKEVSILTGFVLVLVVVLGILVGGPDSASVTFKEWASARAAFAQQLAGHCRTIFEELTDPYAMKPELIPVIAWARRSLNNDLTKLMEEAWPPHCRISSD